MKRSRILCLVALAGLLLLSGCGGKGSGDDFVTTRLEATIDRDALLLAARDVVGYVVPMDAVRTRQEELTSARLAFPELKDIHAASAYNGHELHFAISHDAPWLGRWKSGVLTTGVRELDELFQQYDAKSVTFLHDDGDQSWFNVTFDTYLRANRAAGLFFGKSDALRITSTVSVSGGTTDIRYELVAPNITRMTFTKGETVTVLEKEGTGNWTKKTDLPL